MIRGFVFTHQAGEMTLEAGVHHCRVSRNVFELAVDEKARYLSVSGDDNEIDHNTFRNKSTEGQMIQVQGPGESGMAQRTWIHHNYFHDFRNSRRIKVSSWLRKRCRRTFQDCCSGRDSSKLASRMQAIHLGSSALLSSIEITSRAPRR